MCFCIIIIIIIIFESYTEFNMVKISQHNKKMLKVSQGIKKTNACNVTPYMQCR